tara:strand:+ start:221 stop:892 length:672 start_codon:yes stop_codon:yes gene_type:complete
MVRVKQFADDLGISKNQAKGLINKGRSRKDGGSQILESVMKPKKYKTGGSNKAPTPKTLRQAVKKGLSDKNPLKFFRENKELVKRDITERSDEIQSKMNTTGRRSDKGGGPAPKNRKKPKRAVTKKSSEKTIKDITASTDREFSRKVFEANQKAMKEAGETRKQANPISKRKAGGQENFGMLSVKAGIDKNPNATQADRIAGATKNLRGGGIAIQGLGFKGIR